MRCLLNLKIVASIAMAFALAGCAGADSISMLHPHGLVADAQRRWLIDINLVMAIVVVPVFVLVPLFAWRYRRRNETTAYRPEWSFSWPLEFVVWGVPVLIVASLAVLIIDKQATLDPYDKLKATSQPLEVEVVALDWKFLFIYPQQRIATVGMLAIPQGRPIDFHLTSDSTMQSFFIPALGSQIEPEGLAVSRDGKTVVDVSESTSMAHFIDVPSRGVTSNVLVDTRPRVAEYAPDDKTVWVTSEVGGTVAVIDAGTREVVRKIAFELPGIRPELISPVGLRFSPDGKLAFVALGRANHVAVVDTASGKVLKYILVGDRVWQLVFDPDGKTLYAANGLSNDVSVIDVARLKVTKSVPVGRLPWGLAIRP